MDKQAQAALDFWFSEDNHGFWFSKNANFDALIQNKFSDIWQAAALGELANWRETIKGRLAEIIVLDQFSRNIHRNKAQAFLQDGMALVLAQEAIKKIEFNQLSKIERQFVLMPFMHSESLKIHQQAVVLFKQLEDESTLDFEIRHKAIIERFGRYPHRNQVLGRISTTEEIEFLHEPNSSF